MICDCGGQSETLNNQLIELQRMIMALGWDVPTSLGSCCQKCLSSMINDVKGELSAIQERALQKTGEMFTIVEPDTEEYRTVEARFKDSLTNTVVRIEKINSPLLKSKFDTECEINPGGEYGWYFHGSDNDNYINIITKGFDITKSKSGLLGIGVYFALDASYSYDYTSRIQDKTSTVIKNMLLCNVYKMPRDRVDSRIICISNDRRSYPQYIIYAKA